MFPLPLQHYSCLDVSCSAVPRHSGAQECWGRIRVCIFQSLQYLSTDTGTHNTGATISINDQSSQPKHTDFASVLTSKTRTVKSAILLYVDVRTTIIQACLTSSLVRLVAMRVHDPKPNQSMSAVRSNHHWLDESIRDSQSAAAVHPHCLGDMRCHDGRFQSAGSRYVI